MDLSEYRGAYKKAKRPANDSERRVEQRRSSPGQQRKDREGYSKETGAKEAWKHVTASSSKRRSKAAAPAPKWREYEPTYESEYVARKGWSERRLAGLSKHGGRLGGALQSQGRIPRPTPAESAGTSHGGAASSGALRLTSRLALAHILPLASALHVCTDGVAGAVLGDPDALLGDADESRQRELLKRLQLTRADLKTLLPHMQQGAAGYLVRVAQQGTSHAAGSQTPRIHVVAQIMQIDGDMLHIKGMHEKQRLEGRARRALVSNSDFTEDELGQARLLLQDMPVALATALCEAAVLARAARDRIEDSVK